MNDLTKYKELCEIWTQQWLQYETDEIYREGRISGTIQNKAKGLDELFQKLQSENKDFLLNRITDNKSNQSIDELCFIIDHIRSEGIINYQTPINLEELLEIGLTLCENKLQTNKYLETGYIIDTILDIYWHQTNKDNVSKEIIQNYAPK